MALKLPDDLSCLLLREEMHADLLKLSTRSKELLAKRSSHFVWVDEPDIIVEAIRDLLALKRDLNEKILNFLPNRNGT